MDEEVAVRCLWEPLASGAAAGASMARYSWATEQQRWMVLGEVAAPLLAWEEPVFYLRRPLLWSHYQYYLRNSFADASLVVEVEQVLPVLPSWATFEMAISAQILLHPPLQSQKSHGEVSQEESSDSQVQIQSPLAA